MSPAQQHRIVSWWKAALFAIGNRIPFSWIETRREHRI